MKTLGFTLTLAIAFGLTASAALAQDDGEGGDIDPQGGLLEQGLLEKKDAPPPVLDDPDQKLRDAVDLVRMDLEKRINEMQTKGQTFLDFNEAVEKLVARMLKANDAYVQANRKLVDRYRAAVEANKAKDKDAVGKKLVELRQKHLKVIAVLAKDGEKLEEKLLKLKEKAAKEEAEAEGEDE